MKECITGAFILHKMDTQRLHYLFEQHDSNRITVGERDELYEFLDDYQNKEEVLDFLRATIKDTVEDIAADKKKWAVMIQRILPPSSTPVQRIFNWKRVAVAASILLVLGLASYFFFFNKLGNKDEIVKVQPADVQPPQSTKATITLADGRTITLDSLTSLTQGDVNVVKNANGEVIYTGSATETVYNTLFNPRGSKVVNLTLNDGTKVWLNSESSLKYPTAFAGNTRNVEITGEAYFEVAHNKTKPFYVTKGDMQVLVLGTHFNINTYDDEESIKVTLLEGSVNVLPRASARGTIIKPGQQAIVLAGGEQRIANSVDIEQVLAWKNNLFNCNGLTLATILRQAARWYDVEVVYQSKPTTEVYMGSIPRSVKLSELLKILQLSGVKFSIEGQKLIVM